MKLLEPLSRHSKNIALTLSNLFMVGGMAVMAAEKKQQATFHAGSHSAFLSTGFAYNNQGMLNNKAAFGTVRFGPENKTDNYEEPNGNRHVAPVRIDSNSKTGRVLSGGPGQPEMATFKPVGADNMVDLFSGDFNYNIPLMDVGGYPVNIFYNSGITMDQEASWVGLGWNINPGTISRNMRGIPDDFNGTEKIIQKEHLRDDKTYGVTVGGGFEFFGRQFNLNANMGIFYNNRLGYGLEAGIHPSLSLGKRSATEKTAHLNLGYSLQANSKSGGSQSFSIGLSQEQKKVDKGSLTASLGFHSRAGLQSFHIAGELPSYGNFQKNSEGKVIDNYKISMGSLMNSSISFAYPAMTPSISSKTSSENWSLDLGTGVSGWGAFAHLRLGGYYTNIRIREEDRESAKPAFGYLYLEEGNNNRDALLDFNRLNDGLYTPNNPVIAIPAYTYDVFSITGEGIGGTFRAYRGDVGYVCDPYNESQSESGHLGVEVGGGAYGEGGINANLVLTPSKSGVWETGNLAKSALSFKNSQGLFQAAYFKNPGEKAIPDEEFQDKIGGEELVRYQLGNLGIGTPTLLPKLVKYTDTRQRKPGQVAFTAAQTFKKVRDKRTQVITFLSADEAVRVGLNKTRPSINAFADTANTYFGCVRGRVDSLPRINEQMLPHHLSEINVLSQDGKRYVYGLPVYNLSQVEVSFNKFASVNTELVTYNRGTDDVPGQNTNGKDYYVQTKTLPAYAHSFLLSGILSSNYIDVTGNGITEDDIGDAVKFNYSKMPGNIRWRTPAEKNKASFNVGLKTDKMDDKGHYLTGEKELWYLYSVESKNMIARFYISPNRKDGKAVLDEHGGIDPNYGTYKLDKISLFAKAEITEKGAYARPIKTVHFVYDYSLCKENPTSVSDSGKLTLREIYFTYNGNRKQKDNRYRFRYSGLNPNYVFSANDRWGNYKPSGQNPGGLLNSDYPYTGLDKTSADANATAWTLNEIELPSGASIIVQYEADDYAYVQDRRACNMFTIKGFGDTPTPDGIMLANNKLYESVSHDYNYIYVTVPKEITATGTLARKRQIESWYLGNHSKTKQIYMKLAVTMPTDYRGSGQEHIPIYGEIEDYGFVDDGTYKTIFLKIKKLESGTTPMVQHSLQFMQNFLSSKAYEGSDVSESRGLRAIIRSMGALFRSFKENFSQGFRLFKSEKKCQQVVLSQSFVRLSNPYLIKPGGGIRVKRITINDHWDKMTNTETDPALNNGLEQATYGQEYFYTRKENINGQSLDISSGVASWEPTFGGEENPHKEMLSYFNKNSFGPYDYGSVEMPLAEMFYPSPSVGYSRVEVRSIHRDTVKNAAGIQVTEFFTTKEFPTLSSYTPLEEGDARDPFETKGVLHFMNIDRRKSIGLSQGFKVELNDMNGKMKRQSVYSPLNLSEPVSYTENYYSTQLAGNGRYTLNHRFPVIETADGIVNNNGLIGREIEIMSDFRQHTLETITTNEAINVNVINGFLIPIPVPSFFPPVMYESNIYRSASLLKVVNHYGMLDSIVVMDKGSIISTKNLVYDAETGDPVVTRTENIHRKPVYIFDYPAHWAYEGMGMAYKNIDFTYSGLTFRKGKLETPGFDFSVFESGDEIQVQSYSLTGPPSIPQCGEDVQVIRILMGGFPLAIPLTGFVPKNPSSKIWAVNKSKSISGIQLQPEWLFLDASGEPYSAGNVTIKIIRSGKRNMTDRQVGNIISLANPVRNVGSVNRLVFDNTTKIINAGSATFKDHWRIENSLIYKDSVVKNYTLIPASTFHDTAIVVTVGRDEDGVYSYLFNDHPIINHQKLSDGGDLIRKTWMKFEGLNNLLNQNFNPQNIVRHRPHWQPFISTSMHNHSTVADCFVDTVNSSHPSVHDNPEDAWVSFQNRYPFLGNATLVQLFGFAIWPEQNQVIWRFLYNHGNSYSQGSFINHPFPGSNSIVRAGGSETYLIDPLLTQLFNRRRAGYTDIPAFSFQIFYPTTFKGENNIRCLRSREAICDYDRPRMGFLYYDCPNVVDSFLENDELFYRGYCYTGDTIAAFCLSKYYNKKFINPYTEGIWGNWRTDTTFVYYGNRNESSISTDPMVDTRIAGTILDFKTFWNLDANGLNRNFSSGDVWVWNNTITQYNRKGYEIENHDPLGRYNAGLYGYNQQLPVAVVNNARYREAMFDGFEDYSYKTSGCFDAFLCAPRRHATIPGVEARLDTTEKHTGRYSVKLTNGQQLAFAMPVSDTPQSTYNVAFKIDSTQIVDTVVTPAGIGLTATYLKFSTGGCQGNNLSAAMAINCANNVLANPGSSPEVITRTEPWLLLYRYATLNLSMISLPASFEKQYAARWEGYVQPKKSGFHSFNIRNYHGAKLWINNILVIDAWNVTNYIQNNTVSVHLLAGELCPIKVEYFSAADLNFLGLNWQEPGASNTTSINPLQLYPVGQSSLAGATVSTNVTYCTQPDSIKVTGNALLDTFSLISNKKMLLSAWVKEGGEDCNCSTYQNNTITLQYPGTGEATVTLRPSGNIIEGWQRYEAEFLPPESATEVIVSLNNTGNAPVFFDDLRISPFNSNMKSFVYHSASLKLMAELDENNYASFYEYDDDGTLTRVKKETYRGIKTIKETRSALQKN